MTTDMMSNVTSSSIAETSSNTNAALSPVLNFGTSILDSTSSFTDGFPVTFPESSKDDASEAGAQTTLASSVMVESTSASQQSNSPFDLLGYNSTNSDPLPNTSKTDDVPLTTAIMTTLSTRSENTTDIVLPPTDPLHGGTAENVTDNSLQPGDVYNSTSGVTASSQDGDAQTSPFTSTQATESQPPFSFKTSIESVTSDVTSWDSSTMDRFSTQAGIEPMTESIRSDVSAPRTESHSSLEPGSTPAQYYSSPNTPTQANQPQANTFDSTTTFRSGSTKPEIHSSNLSDTVTRALQTKSDSTYSKTSKPTNEHVNISPTLSLPRDYQQTTSSETIGVTVSKASTTSIPISTAPSRIGSRSETFKPSTINSIITSKTGTRITSLDTIGNSSVTSATQPGGSGADSVNESTDEYRKKDVLIIVLCVIFISLAIILVTILIVKLVR